MSNRVTSENFENHSYYRKYLDQLTELHGDTISSVLTTDSYEISASLKRPVSEDLVRAIWALIEHTDDPNDFSATFDKDGFDAFFKLRPDQVATLPDKVEPLVRKAVRDFRINNPNTL